MYIDNSSEALSIASSADDPKYFLAISKIDPKYSVCFIPEYIVELITPLNTKFSRESEEETFNPVPRK
jgi:hypothetical protein